MGTRFSPLGAIAAALAVTACAPTRPLPYFGPADGMPNAVIDEGSIMQSPSVGGSGWLGPFVVDGWVRQVTAKTVLIESDGLGNRQVRVTPRTEITVDGKAAPLGRIAVGMPIRAAYSRSGVALGLQAGKWAWSDELPARALSARGKSTSRREP